MGLFGSGGGAGYLGIDIGSSSIKIVELKNEKGRPKLVTYGYADQASGILKSETKESKESIVKAIQLVREKSRTKSNRVVAALPSYTVFSSIIALPEMPKKELEEAVQWEAKKFVPMPIEEMILDWKILENLDEFGRASIASQDNPHTGNGQSEAKVTTQGQKQLKILITAAPKKLVSKYVEIFKMAQLQLVSLETESFALERALVGNDKSPILLIDIGATATNIVVVVASVPLINRSIDLGGKTITQSLAGSLNIDQNRAEQFKRDFGLAAGQAQGGPQQIPQRIEFMVNSVINEVKYVIDLYQSQTQKPLEKVILAGGSAWLPNLSDYLAQALQLKVFIGDPWSRVIYPTDLKPVLREIGPSLAVSVGLAMREII